MSSLFRRARLRGFTLLELIVVVVVLGILAALAIPSFASVKQSAANKVAYSSAEALVRDARALAAFDGAALDDTYLDLAGQEVGARYDASTNTLTVNSGGKVAQAAIDATTGVITITVPSSGNGGGNNGGGNGSSSYGPVTTLAAGTFSGITISHAGPAQVFNSGYMYRAIPVAFTLSDGATIMYYNADWTMNPGYRLQPVLYDASGVEITDTSWMFNTGELKGSAITASQHPTIDQSSGAPFYAMLLDYTNPNQASWYTSTTDVFAGASIAFRVYDISSNQLLGYTNRVATNWG